MAKKKHPDLKERLHGENNTGHYNFVIIDRELIFVTDKSGKNIPSTLGLSLEALGLYTVLKAHAIDKNFVWPSLSTLAKLTGSSINTIQKYITELVDRGLVVKEKSANPRGGQPVNVYIIPGIDKERIKYDSILSQLSKIDTCYNQLSKSDSCNYQKMADDNCQNLISKETNINIINELKLKAQAKEFPSGVEDGFIKLIDTIKSDPRGYCFLSGDNLVIKYRYEIAVRRDVNMLLDAIGLYESINVVYEN